MPQLKIGDRVKRVNRGEFSSSFAEKYPDGTTGTIIGDELDCWKIKLDDFNDGLSPGWYKHCCGPLIPQAKCWR